MFKDNHFLVYLLSIYLYKFQCIIHSSRHHVIEIPQKQQPKSILYLKFNITNGSFESKKLYFISCAYFLRKKIPVFLYFGVKITFSRTVDFKFKYETKANTHVTLNINENYNIMLSKQILMDFNSSAQCRKLNVAMHTNTEKRVQTEKNINCSQ